MLKSKGLINKGFRRGWSDADDGHPSQALRFFGDFLVGYFDGYRFGQKAQVEKKTFEQSRAEWSNLG